MCGGVIPRGRLPRTSGAGQCRLVDMIFLIHGGHANAPQTFREVHQSMLSTPSALFVSHTPCRIRSCRTTTQFLAGVGHAPNASNWAVMPPGSAIDSLAAIPIQTRLPLASQPGAVWQNLHHTLPCCLPWVLRPSSPALPTFRPPDGRPGTHIEPILNQKLIFIFDLIFLIFISISMICTTA